MPDEYLPILLEVIRLFRQTVTLKPADESFRQGWQEARRGETMPVSDLWVDLGANDDRPAPPPVGARASLQPK